MLASSCSAGCHYPGCHYPGTATVGTQLHGRDSHIGSVASWYLTWGWDSHASTSLLSSWYLASNGRTPTLVTKPGDFDHKFHISIKLPSCGQQPKLHPKYSLWLYLCIIAYLNTYLGKQQQEQALCLLCKHFNICVTLYLYDYEIHVYKLA